MALRKEQIVFAGTVLLLGWMFWSARAEAPSRASTKHAAALELAPHPAPDPAIALPEVRATSDRQARDIFSPPSDTHPLPPLDLAPIPLAPLAMLAPPPEPGPMPSLYGKFLRLAPFTLDAPGLFAAETADAGADAPDAAAPATKASDLSAEEKAMRVSGYKKLYDWVRTVEFKFGEIKNPDRYQLARRANEDVLFVEFNPETGKPRLPNQAPIPLSRTLVTEFGFADTIQNQVEKGRAELDDPLTAIQYDPALAFADWCVEERLETPRALEVAEEIYRRAMGVRTEDPLPHLGLARCYEAGFEFEKAYQEYQSLLAGTHARDPLVLSRVGELEARFRLFDDARAHLLDAERYGRTQWAVQRALGRFLLSRRRAPEAVEHLLLASQNEPSGAERKRDRARIRADLGAALLGAGDVAGAAEWFDKARQADPSEPSALVGSLCAAALPSGSSGRSGSDSGLAWGAVDVAGVDFDFLLASGVEALSHHDAASFGRAKQVLLAAAAADPFRAHLAWRALSFLAEVTGNPEEALRFVEQAVENDPGDPYALYQRGRILASRDDLDGAMDSFSRALEVELEFPDALAAMGEIQNRRGEFAAAERYLEHALALDAKLAGVAALRGVNFLGLGSVADAEKSFQAALALQKDQPTAQNGLAWCRYLRGEVQEALTQLGEIDDRRRSFPETEPHRAWARAQLARIQDHIQKVAWTDRFERTDLMNGWQRNEQAGPQVSIHDGMVTLSGSFNQTKGLARIWQARGASAFVSFQARLTIHAESAARVGIFVSRETERNGEITSEAEVTLSRNPEPGKNTIQTRISKRGEDDLEYTDVAGFDWKPDTSVVVRIERTGESSDTRVRLLVDGFPVLDNKPVPNLGRTTSELRIGLFARGDVGRKVLVDMDDVEIVSREKK